MWTYRIAAPSVAEPPEPERVQLSPALGQDCPPGWRDSPACLRSKDGFSLAVESITPAPPARLEFGQNVSVQLRYSSPRDDITIQVQLHTNGGCGGYDDESVDYLTRVPAAAGGLITRSYKIFSTFTTGCGQTDIRIEDGEVYGDLIRLLLLDPNDPNSGSFYDQHLYADYRYGPPESVVR